MATPDIPKKANQESILKLTQPTPGEKKQKRTFKDRLGSVARGLFGDLGVDPKTGKRSASRTFGDVLGAFGEGISAPTAVPGRTGTGLEGIASLAVGAAGQQEAQAKRKIAKEDRAEKKFRGDVALFGLLNDPGAEFSDTKKPGFTKLPESISQRAFKTKTKFFKAGPRFDPFRAQLNTAANRAKFRALNLTRQKNFVLDLRKEKKGGVDEEALLLKQIAASSSGRQRRKDPANAIFDEEGIEKAQARVRKIKQRRSEVDQILRDVSDIAQVEISGKSKKRKLKPRLALPGSRDKSRPGAGKPAAGGSLSASEDALLGP